MSGRDDRRWKNSLRVVSEGDSPGRETRSSGNPKLWPCSTARLPDWRKGALILVAGLVVLATSCSGESSKGVTIGFHYSRFGPDVITVPAGVLVTFILRNDDPIEHEWIVGPEEVHERHRLGAEPYHDQLPTEITVPALSTRSTTLTFNEPAEYAFLCHLPGHEAYGMRGTLRVVAP